MKKKNIIIFIFLVVSITSIFIINNYLINKKEEITLTGVEILNYKSENLSSINDFRENSIKGPQYVDIKNYKLKVWGLVEKELNYTYEEIINKFQKYEKVTTLNCVEGWSAKVLWEGFLVRDLISEAIVKDNAKVLIFYAYDGYTTSFPIEYFYDKDIIIAYKINGLILPPERGFPFQLVAEEKWGYKWIKWITQIEISDNEEYRGYWEERGFSNDGDIDKSFIENPK
ncbi:MAG: molybdopterin-dependent oxidoreductase [Caldisericia bacterium]|jgi:DMSO/TMAO reductase YedYZ molybdopterin-dependent catalytic subunit|nr:molybdopterin-dependent oxidoreductase [Caldisericia bacterium]